MPQIKQYASVNHMVNNNELDDIFTALSDPTRRHILEQLAKHELSITELAKPYRMSLPAISKHIKVLEKAQLIHRQIYGREHKVHLNSDRLYTAMQYIESYAPLWSARFD